MDKGQQSGATASSILKAEDFIVYHKDAGGMFVCIQWTDYGSNFYKNVANFSVYLTLYNT
jgi:hypothetical protein